MEETKKEFTPRPERAERPQRGRRRRKVCAFCVDKVAHVDFKAAGKINELVAEANGKVMSFVSCQLDPLFESSDLKATGTGIYQEVFDTVDYDNKSGADVVDTLLDGMSAVGYTV